MDYRIYVINLDRATLRLAAMSTKLGELALPFERISAVDGRAMSVAEREAFSRARPRRNGWLPGAIGCFCSHRHAWERISTGPERLGVVLEDDIHLSQCLPAVLDNMSMHDGLFDIVRLEGTRHRVLLNLTEKLSAMPITLYGVRSETWGAGAYVITREAARCLLMEPIAHQSPVDFFLFDKKSSNVARRHRIYQSVPALCVQSKFDPEGSHLTAHGSDIEHNSEDSRWRYQLRVAGWRLRGLRNFLAGYRRIALSDDIVRH